MARNEQHERKKKFAKQKGEAGVSLTRENQNRGRKELIQSLKALGGGKKKFGVRGQKCQANNSKGQKNQWKERGDR